MKVFFSFVSDNFSAASASETPQFQDTSSQRLLTDADDELLGEADNSAPPALEQVMSFLDNHSRSSYSWIISVDILL
jgi:hypothetical protein